MKVTPMSNKPRFVSPPLNTDPDAAPARDAKGRFKPGHSGNPRGRPRAEPRDILPLGPQFAAALAEEVEVRERNGKKRTMTRYEMVVERMLSGLEDAKPKEQLDALLRLRDIGGLPEPVDEHTRGAEMLRGMIYEFLSTKPGAGDIDADDVVANDDADAGCAPDQDRDGPRSGDGDKSGDAPEAERSIRRRRRG